VIDPSAFAFVDFESRSRADLDAIGGRLYAEHPSTDVLCAVLIDGSGAYELTDYDDHPPVYENLVAHNAINFDRHIWRKLGWPEPKRWVDTAELARVGGYPQASLDALAELLLDESKDHEGNALTLSLSEPSKYYGPVLDERLEQAKLDWRAANPKGCGLRLPTPRLKKELVAQLDADGHPPAPVPAAVLERVVGYCRSDTEQLVRIAEYLLPWLDSDVPGLEAADRAMADRGICFDVQLARLLLDVDAALGAQALERAGVADKVEVSPARLTARLDELGVLIEDCTADTLRDVLKRGGLPERAKLLIEARQASSSIAAGKLRAGLARVSRDGRMRDNRSYYGAHTGRYSGRGMQLDNTAKGV
jgi:DNA polymerase bacteriophage-type